MKFLMMLSILFLVSCKEKEVVVAYPKYVLMPCSYATTSKAGTVLEIKTVCRMEQDTGLTVYANQGEWYRF